MRANKTPRYANYTGDKQWIVQHPRHGRLMCKAPSADAAMVAAAACWLVDWTRIEYYAECVVLKA